VKAVDRAGNTSEASNRVHGVSLALLRSSFPDRMLQGRPTP
jgi:hypothetical protein